MKTILIIEDDQDLRETTAELLELSNYKVLTAENGKTGIVKALKHTPDLIICDIMMPEIDGYEVLESLTLSENTKFTPFIFLTAKTEHYEIRKGMNMGADDYLTKPFEEEELLRSIETRLKKAELFKIQQGKGRDEKEQWNEETEKAPQNLEELKEFFIKNGKEEKFDAEACIFKKGEHSNNSLLITDGMVKTHVMDFKGKELITGLYKPGDFIGFTSFDENISFTESATALKNTTIVGIPKESLREILQENRQISLELMNLLSDNLSEIKKQLIRMAYSSVRKKTASTIIRFVELMSNHPEEAIKISRNDLAANAGIAPESLIRTLSEFKKKNLIKIDGRSIQVLEPEKLRHMN